MENKKPFVWSHRGASGYCPENTLAAFEKAVELKSDGVELDVQLTSDGKMVICHDEKVDRTSNGKGWIKDMTFDEIRALDFSCGNQDFKGAKIPTLQEVFELLKHTELTINIELKTGIVFYDGIEKKIVDLVEEYEFMRRVVFSSFNHYTVKRVKELRPEAKCGFLYMDGPIDMPGYGKFHGVEALHPALYNLQFPDFMKDCREKGLEVNVWTANSEEHIIFCCKAGVNAIITDYPDKTRAVIDTPAKPYRNEETGEPCAETLK